MDIYGAIGNNSASPDGIHELLTGAHFAMSRQQFAEQAILRTCKTNRRSINGNHLLIEAYLQALEHKVAFAKARLYNVHHIVAQFLAIGHHIHIHGADGIRGLVGIDIVDALCLKFIAQSIDIAFYLHRVGNRHIFTSPTNHNHHLRQSLVYQTKHLV